MKNKLKVFIVKSEEVIDSIADFLREEIPGETPLEVTVRPFKTNRSMSQNSLYWIWVGIIADEFGWTKEEVHEDLKGRFLSLIYERDNPVFAETMQAIRKVYEEGYYQEGRSLHNQVIRLTSTTTATIKQFTEYLNDIERDAISKGLVLPHPEDRYYEALGMKRAV